jgi:hypothetical protein
LKELLEAEDSEFDDTNEGDATSKIKPYDPDQIKVRQDKYALDFVVSKMIDRQILDLNTDFQRKFVWDRKRQATLIESLMLGIPIPVMYLSESVKEKFHVVDGLQSTAHCKSFKNFCDLSASPGIFSLRLPVHLFFAPKSPVASSKLVRLPADRSNSISPNSSNPKPAH